MTTSKDREENLITAAKRFAQDYVRPQAAAWTNNQDIPREAFVNAAAAGLLSIETPEHLGGMGCSFSTKSKIAEVLAYADFGFSMAVINTHNVALKLAAHPSLLVVTKYLPDLVSGHRIRCTALTEAGTGSDFANIIMRAEQRPDGWILNGEKSWITNAALADTVIVYAQTGQPGNIAGIAAFLIDGRREGFERGPHTYPMGLSAIGSGGLRLNNYKVGLDEIIGAPGSAFKAIMNEINGARIYVASMCCGMLQSALDQAGRYGATRQTFPKRRLDQDFGGIKEAARPLSVPVVGGPRFRSHSLKQLRDRWRRPWSYSHRAASNCGFQIALLDKLSFSADFALAAPKLPVWLD